MKHRFVEYIPQEIEEGVLYISLEFDTAKHKCPCGCGEDVFTTLSPARWKLTYDGETVSLDPSIGNWYLDCKSHYFIKNDQVIWAGNFSSNQIEAAVKRDKESLKQHLENQNANPKGFLAWIKNIFRN